MDNEITVSVLISYYNQKKYVKDSIESVINQKTKFQYEIICGDDGSVDGTYEELLGWKQKYPNLIRVFQMSREKDVHYEPIVRASNNRFNMLKKARGKYVTILDGDDYYCDENKLQKQVDILEKYPDCSCCCHSMKYVWDDGSKPDEPLGYISEKKSIISNRNYWACVWLPAEAFLFRNYFIHNSDEINKDFFDDNLITAYFIKKGSIFYIPDCMTVYRQVGDSSWNKRNELEKAYVNTIMYQESKRVLTNMKLECFFRCQGVLHVWYKNRNNSICVNNSNTFVASDPIYTDTLKYKESSIWYKIKYILKYFIPAHAGKLVALRCRLSRLTWKRV